MRNILILLTLTLMWPIGAPAQHRPCGTSVLQKRHAVLRDNSPVRRTRTTDFVPSGYEGEKRGLVILVSFPNQAFSEPDSKAAWTARICEEDHSEKGSPGSVADYFRDQSYGRFRLTFDVVGPVEVSQPYEYYGKNVHSDIFDDWFDKADDELVEEACRAVSDSVRFADYDWDDDGMVEEVFILYAGHGENDYYHKSEDVIWPHMGRLTFDWGHSEPLAVQDVFVDIYACSNELDARNAICGIGTICHEFSHCLGLPDLYDSVSGVSVLGNYDLMDSGNYNGDGWVPCGYSSYERYACGWLQPQPIDNPKVLLDSIPASQLQPLHLLANARIYHPSDSAVYYLIERRVKESWDKYLPKDGMQAWYIDYDQQVWDDNLVNVGYHRVERLAVDDIPVPVAITLPLTGTDKVPVAVYDIQGRRLPLSTLLSPHSSLLIVKYSDGTIRKK